MGDVVDERGRVGQRFSAAERGLVGPDFEYVAARVMARALSDDVRVVLQDDNRDSSMPDLRIERPRGDQAFGEVTLDLDPIFARTYARMFASDFPIHARQLSRVWNLSVRRSCRIDELVPKAVDLLLVIDRSPVRSGHVVVTDIDDPHTGELARLGVIDMWPSSPHQDGSGGVCLLPEAVDGPATTDWQAVDRWLETLLASDRLAAKTTKLGRSGSQEQHLFIGVTYSSPGEVFFAFEDTTGVPSPPSTPAEISGLWLWRTPSAARALLWSDSEWRWV